MVCEERLVCEMPCQYASRFDSFSIFNRIRMPNQSLLAVLCVVAIQLAQAPTAHCRSVLAGATNIPSVKFTDITNAYGITFVHNNGAYGEKLLPETMGGGV